MAIGAKNMPMPMPLTMNGGTKADVRGRGAADRGEPAEADRHQCETDDQERPSAEPAGEPACDGRHDGRHRRPGKDAESGLERVEALNDLEELGQQEDGPEHPEVHQHRDEVGDREAPAAEHVRREHDCTQDRYPRAGTADGLIYGMGYSGQGAQLSTLIGSVLADIAIGRRDTNPIDDMQMTCTGMPPHCIPASRGSCQW